MDDITCDKCGNILDAFDVWERGDYAVKNKLCVDCEQKSMEDMEKEY